MNAHMVLTCASATMISQKDAEIITHLRSNARKKVTEISRKLGMPVTTIYDKVRSHTTKGIVKKHTALLDFSKLGFSASALIAMKVSKERLADLEAFLINHPNINSLYRVNLGHDFFAEAVFPDITRLQDFIDEAQTKFNIDRPDVFTIVKELKKEEFMTKPEHFGLV